jgi:hypothetical protein
MAMNSLLSQSKGSGQFKDEFGGGESLVNPGGIDQPFFPDSGVSAFRDVCVPAPLTNEDQIGAPRSNADMLSRLPF